MPLENPSLNPDPRPTLPATVFLVDDDTVLRNLTAYILQGSGYTVLQAAHGKEALQIASEHLEPIQLLIADVQMPDMDGTVLAERLVTIHPEMKVLFLSGFSESDVIGKRSHPNSAQFLEKPFFPDALIEKVRDVLVA
jgi:two-component system, cell cycle sensor histidine kinase and response regulator CckA